MSGTGKHLAKKEMPPTCAVLLAGGRGTRFWPRSRMQTPKQLLNIVGNKTMLRETVERLEPIVPLKNFWVVTNAEQSAGVRRELRGVPATHILAEPVGRNTAAAIGLAAIHLTRKHGDALMAVLPADSYISDAARYRSLARAALDLARTPGNMAPKATADHRRCPPGYCPRTGRSRIHRDPVLAKGIAQQGGRARRARADRARRPQVGAAPAIDNRGRAESNTACDTRAGR